MELGRIDEAREQFRQAEDLIRAFPNPFHERFTVSNLRKELREKTGRSERAFEVRVPPQA
jgi:hypothetical protein